MSTSKQVAVIITAENHKHAGQPVAKGTRIETDEATARWLIDNKIGLAAGGTVAADAADTGKKESK